MIDELRALAIFAETAKQGSFKKAAIELGLSPSVVSYHISELEKRIDCALIYRSTRKLSLTHEGQILLQHAQKMLLEAQTGLEKVVVNDQELKGKLSITLPSALTRSPLISKIVQFCQSHPLIELNIVFSDVRQDLISDSFDLAVRIGDLENSSFVSKKIGHIQRKLVCTPAFIEQQCLQHNISTTVPSDLSFENIQNWPWIKLSMLSNKRRFISRSNVVGVRSLVKTNNRKVEKGSSLELEFTSHIAVDSVEAMTQFCLLGCGIATPPDFLVEHAIKNKTLIELLPQWQVEDLPLFAVWHNSSSVRGPVNKKVRRLMEYLTGE
jgi:DNA-binding transcriptional LysR family regulator